MGTTRAARIAPGGALHAERAARVQVHQILHARRPQAKLTVGPPGDAYEREADRVADAVMRAPDAATQDGQVQRVCAECEEAELHRVPAEDSELEDEEMRREPAGPGGALLVGPAVESGIQALRGAGQLLPVSERAFFEPRLGADLSTVRVHSDANAATVARDVSARAFTLGPDVVFAKDAYAPDTSEGRQLLAHELTHVVQQRAATAPAGRLARQPVGAPDTAPALVPLAFTVDSTDLTPKVWSDRGTVNLGGADTRTNIVIGGPANATIDITHACDDTQTYGHTHTNEPAGPMARRFKHGHLTNRADGKGGEFNDFQIDAAGNDRTITYHAPHAAGEVVLEARIRGRADAAAQAAARVTTEVTGLQEYATTQPNEMLVGQVANHDTNHWGTAAAATRIQNIVTAFRDAWAAAAPGRDPDDAPTIQINDMSLEHGGVYDFQDNWYQPHQTHRFGEDIDISRRVLVGGVSTHLKPGTPTAALYNLLNTAIGVEPENEAHWHVDV